MKIISNKKHKYIEFKDLVKGEVFKFGANYLIKTAVISKEGDRYANAVFLKTGDYTLFYGYEKILPINASMVIDDDEEENEEDEDENS